MSAQTHTFRTLHAFFEQMWVPIPRRRAPIFLALSASSTHGAALELSPLTLTLSPSPNQDWVLGPS